MVLLPPTFRACRLRSMSLLYAAVAGCMCLCGAVPLSAQSPSALRFNRDVRPILADHCFACHGPDAGKREADLRLDTQEGLLGTADAEGVVVSGNPEASRLWERIASTDPDVRMPPPGFGKDLSSEQLAVLRGWIEQGAPWEGHWAFEPLTRPAVPQSDALAAWAANDVDAFLFDAMQAHGLSPSAEADRRTLIRRLSLDLRGLPPTVEEVERFVADEQPDAYERLVDTLLASPQYGERMAVFWLDLVRYADSVGYHGDQEVSISPFRDYVIQAFNDNLPFDQFTREQLAGDLLPEPALPQQIASGYNRLGMMSAEGGVQPREYLAKYISERVRNLGGAWLGSTLGCCECHNHKYDPFTMQDFYSFQAFFADIEEQGLYAGAHATGNWGPNIPVPTPEQARRLSELDAALAHVQQTLAAHTPALEEARLAWERSLPVWTTLRPVEAASENAVVLTTLEDGSLLASGPNPDTDVYRLSFDNLPQGVTAVRIEVLPDDSLPNRGPGRAGNGNFVLSEVVAHVRAPDLLGDADAEVVPLAAARATYEQTGFAEGNPYGRWAVAAAIDGDAQGDKWGWAVMEQAGQPNAAVFEFAAPLAGGEGSRLTLELRQKLDNPQHTLGRFRISVTTSAPPIRLDVAPAEIAALLALPESDRTPEQVEQLRAHYRSIAPELAEARAQQQALQQERQALDASIVRTLVTRTVEPRVIRVLSRGNWMDESGEVRLPAFPEFLPGAPPATDRRLTRLDLAQWVTSPENPLTARVFANRMWKLFFGAGLSRRLDDLGAQGEPPSHPELLDYLATRFIDSGWDVKRLVRLIVTSRAYRQSSQSDPVRDERDLANRWLSRQNRFRLEAEFVRDVALRTAGLLVEELGGTSVRPYQPPGYWAYLNFPTREWANDGGPRLYRRGLYTHWQRQYLHPSLVAFDAPSREECAADRPRSNTPLQSLVLLNDPIYVEAARVFAEQMLRLGGASDAERIAWAYARALSRPPRDEELAVLTELLAQHRAHYASDSEAARQIIAVGAAPVATDLDPVELAAWTSVARTLLNLHETITRN